MLSLILVSALGIIIGLCFTAFSDDSLGFPGTLGLIILSTLLLTAEAVELINDLEDATCTVNEIKNKLDNSLEINKDSLLVIEDNCNSLNSEQN